MLVAPGLYNCIDVSVCVDVDICDGVGWYHRCRWDEAGTASALDQSNTTTISDLK